MNRLTQNVVLLTGSHLCTNPRSVKEADSLSKMGFEVEVLGRRDLPGLFEQDKILLKNRKWKFSPSILKPMPLSKMIGRAQRFLGMQLFSSFGLENRWQLGPLAAALYKEARKRSASLYIAHSEVGMWAIDQLRRDGKKVGVDMEDWFSEDLMPEARRRRPIRLLKNLERNLLCHGVHSTCTSEAMADALVNSYGCRRPTVIRNVFPRKEREELDGKWKDRPGMARWMTSNDPKVARPKEAPVSIHWFSQTIGPGRGLEELFVALEGLGGGWELHLRGNLKGYEKWLNEVCPSGVAEKTRIHSPVSNEELPSRIAEHDIGFCGEPISPPNKNLTISNKFFQYMQAGLVVVASNTTGQREAASEAGGGVVLYSSGDADKLERILNSLIGKSGDMAERRWQAWNAGARLCWENEQTKLVETINETIEHKR